MNEKKELCKEIGSFFGKFYTEGDMICVDTGDKVYKYADYTDMLLDWVDTLIESHKSGGGNWEREIVSIYSLSPKKHPVGVRCVNGQKGLTWKSSVDVCNHDYPHGKNLHLGSYKSIIDAIDARKRFLSCIEGIDTNTQEGFNLTTEIAKEIQIEAKKKKLCENVFVEGSYIGGTCNLCVHEHENWGDNKYCKSCNNRYKN